MHLSEAYSSHRFEIRTNNLMNKLMFVNFTVVLPAGPVCSVSYMYQIS